MRFRLRQDANHGPIRMAYEAMGVAVVDLSKVRIPGLPDLLCSLHGFTWLSETKTPDGEITPEQKHFVELWKGETCVTRTEDDVIAKVMEVRSRCR